ncbi:MAG TPA: efflux RND transporter periplasmic adaptor subunit [Verrucomicrobiae bacterium]|nr:efflux RND transporter periplasmic adaptor subunit [Verrucomicrobiae bacterium]
MNNGNPANERKALPPPKRSSPLKWIVIVGVVLVLVIIGLAIVRRREAAAKQLAQARNAQQPVPVVVSPVKESDVPVYLDGLGTVQAFNTVTVHVRVDGQLKQINFTEGQDVRKGDVLAIIDPAPFQAALDQAKAKKGQDQALLDNANLDMKRETDLYAAKVDSQQIYDTQKALVAQDQAAVNADQAAIDAAQVNLDYCSVVSPIDGRTGLRLVDVGNIVHAADLGGIVVITQLKPISVVFTLPEQDLEQIHKHEKTTNELKVLAVGRDNGTNLDTGTLAVIDNEIDTTTGTIRLKANFPNEDLQLWPGEFVNTRLLTMMRLNSLTVPEAAIQRGPTGAYVFVVTNVKPTNSIAGGKGKRGANSAGSAADSTPALGGSSHSQAQGTNAPTMWAKIQNVTVASQMEAGQALIETGVTKGQRVVTDGQYKLQDGSPIRVSNGAKKSAPTSDQSTNVESAPQDITK